jgi:hypothetical protein
MVTMVTMMMTMVAMVAMVAMMTMTILGTARKQCSKDPSDAAMRRIDILL